MPFGFLLPGYKNGKVIVAKGEAVVSIAFRLSASRLPFRNADGSPVDGESPLPFGFLLPGYAPNGSSINLTPRVSIAFRLSASRLPIYAKEAA